MKLVIRESPQSSVTAVSLETRPKMAISVVDVEKISIQVENPSPEDFANLAIEIKECFGKIGFMYIKNHGLSAETINKAMRSSLKFFGLDKKVKERTRKGAEYQGWVEQGREIFDQDENGKIAQLEVRETFDLKNISPSGIFPDEVQYKYRSEVLVMLASFRTALS